MSFYKYKLYSVDKIAPFEQMLKQLCLGSFDIDFENAYIFIQLLQITDEINLRHLNYGFCEICL